jgi:2-polyprenyl-3-methyl-5-hydroxy-6-metoxy-1,4-benzoquinol methylase
MSDEGIRSAYEQHGVQEFYERYGDIYRNPHEAAVQAVLRQGLCQWEVDLSQVLDLACGSGEVTLILREMGAQRVNGIDPYTGPAYWKRVGQKAEAFSFEQIAAGMLEDRHYSLIVCSFALHLLDISRLPRLAYQLSRISPALIVITPHKRPRLREEWGWTLWDEIVVARVKARLYRSQNAVS